MLALLLAAAVTTTKPEYRNTYCNGYYNSAVKRWDSIKCEAWFSQGRLTGLKFKVPQSQKFYIWNINQPEVEPDKNWKECLRYTHPQTGNQWQFCTVKNLQQLKIKL